MLIAFNKPYGVLSQFTKECPEHRTLAEFGFPKGAYPIGRLDFDSEGLLLLSNEGALNGILLNPQNTHPRVYWAQVENIPASEDLARFRNGLVIQNYKTLPANAKILEPQPDIPERIPPIRFRKAIPTCWIEVRLTEGKNRQVRKMTAAIGFPTLRLIRVQIGNYRMSDLEIGAWKRLDSKEKELVLQGRKRETGRIVRKVKKAREFF